MKVFNALKLNICLGYTNCWSTCLILAELPWMLQGVPSISERHAFPLNLALHPLLLGRGFKIFEILRWH